MRAYLIRPVVLALAPLIFAACGTIGIVNGEDEAEAHAKKLQQLQLQVMRFADEYSGRVIGSVNAFQKSTTLAADRLAAQNWKLEQCTSAYTIASGPNAVTNALDMVVLATLSRMVMQDARVGERFGSRADEIRDAHEGLEQRSWRLVDEALTDEQKTSLQAFIEGWREKNPHVASVAYIHFTDFAKSLGQTDSGQMNLGSIFSVIGLDPLSNLDPAVQEITQTRQLAERTIYYAQRAPNLIDMQIERLTYQLSAMPEMRQMLDSVDRTATAAQRAGELAAALPATFSQEREAAIAQFMDALYAQEERARALLTELRASLEAGTATSNSLGETLRSFDTLMARFAKPAGAAQPPATPGKPFDIAEYSAAAREFAATTRELERLVRTLDTSAAGVDQMTERLVDHLFWRIAQLVVLLVAVVFAAALGYRAFTKA
jgi:hypothetical protein